MAAFDELQVRVNKGQSDPVAALIALLSPA